MMSRQQQHPSTTISTKTSSGDTPIDVSASFGNMTLPFCLYNASGPRSGTIEALQKIAQSKSGAVLTKSATLLSQDGNPLPRTYHAPDQMASFNSEGLPNKGIDYYISSETRMAVMDVPTSTTTTTKPYVVSLSGKCLNDNLEMIRRIVSVNHQDMLTSSTTTSIPQIASIELNLACPNVIGKPIIGYDMDQMEQTLRQVDQVIQECHQKYSSSSSSTSRSINAIVPPLGIKLPPYLDFSHFHSVTQLLNQYSHIVSYVVAINTVGNALCVDGQVMGTPHISSNNGYAGLSGPAIKYTALANVRKLRELLIPTIDVVGVGGICTGQDVYDMILCGARCCQVATQHWKEGSSICFDRIYNELILIMQQKGFTNIQQQVYNQLQPYSKERANIARQLQQEQKSKVNTSLSSSNDNNSNGTDDVQFYKTLSIVLIIVLAIVLSYELQQRNSLLPTE